jgi:hypothetical protein
MLRDTRNTLRAILMISQPSGIISRLARMKTMKMA